MPTLLSTRRFARYFLVILFTLGATTYSVIWIQQTKHTTPQPGFTSYRYSAATSSMTVGEVLLRSPAAKAGLRPGDQIVAIAGQKLESLRPFYQEIIVGQNEVLELTITDLRSPGGVRRLQLQVHGGERVPARSLRWADLLGLSIDYYPLCFLVVGVAVLVLRPGDASAWLLALLFGGFLAMAPLFEGNIPPLLRGFVVSYKIVMSWCSFALFYYFFAVFPAPSPMDRTVPWLKYLLVGATILSTLPVGLRCLVAGGTLPLYLGWHWPGAGMVRWVLALQTGLPFAAPSGRLTPRFVFVASFIGAVTLGVASLISNCFLSPDAQARRKARVMVWGTVVGTAPVCLVAIIVFVVGWKDLPLAWWQISVLLLASVWPLSFAYAVVKHRVLEIPVLLRRSARYVLVQRGYFVSLFAAAAVAIALFTHTISRFFPEGSNLGMTASAVFGIALVWASAPVVKRGTDRIDQAFFRSAYDARVILQELAEQARTVTERAELVQLLESKIAGALHPKSLACYLEAEDGNLAAAHRTAHDEPGSVGAALPQPEFPMRFGALFLAKRLNTISADLPLLQELTQRGKAWDVPQTTETISGSNPLAPECMVPILGRDSRLIGLLVLGPRLSEEPYSSEDKKLLDSVASQAGITLENIHLAENMAQRIEAERRAALEMDFARRVQARLFPQKLPALETLDYVGGCVQARQVGGDYYDFLDMGPGAIGIVLADISGKGMSGALLMANLQANLRSQYAIGLHDLPRLLQSVNRLFYENTTDESYATMFFGIYEDSRRMLRFANCGHIPPIIVGRDGSVRRLASTTTVLGLFLDWESAVEEVSLCPGDFLVICTDGVTEAPNQQQEEYGEARLIEVLQENRDMDVNELLAVIQARVQEFSGPTQADDITVIVARCR